MVLVIAGLVLVVIGLLDVFLTVLNYDGFSFLTSRVYRMSWGATRAVARRLPGRPAQMLLSLAAPAMLPGTVAIWVGLEIVGFALIYQPAMEAGWFSIKADIEPTFGQALYLSGVTLATLGYGDIVPGPNFAQALSVFEALIGFAILTLTVSYVLATFRVLEQVRALADTLGHIIPANRSTIDMSRDLLRAGVDGVGFLLEKVHDGLQAYDEGVRLYPIVYYFHSRDLRRSVPYTFAMVGEIVAALAYGVRGSHPVAHDPRMRAMAGQYRAVRERLLASFLRTTLPGSARPLSTEKFDDAAHGRLDDDSAHAFLKLEGEMALALGEDRMSPEWAEDRYDRYTKWLHFTESHRAFVDRLACDLGYPPDRLPVWDR